GGGGGGGKGPMTKWKVIERRSIATGVIHHDTLEMLELNRIVPDGTLRRRHRAEEEDAKKEGLKRFKRDESVTMGYRSPLKKGESVLLKRDESIPPPPPPLPHMREAKVVGTWNGRTITINRPKVALAPPKPEEEDDEDDEEDEDDAVVAVGVPRVGVKPVRPHVVRPAWHGVTIDLTDD
ncbi:hypothetical protein HK101_005311, partial [Irineochytrium annulatum]